MKYLLLSLCLALVAGAASIGPADEIEALLRYVGNLDGAALIRNGTAHSPKEAEAHLRMKWSKQKAQIASAEDFIRLCATESSASGKPYLIRFKDGHEEPAAAVLHRELRLLRAKPPSTSARDAIAR